MSEKCEEQMIIEIALQIAKPGKVGKDNRYGCAPYPDCNHGRLQGAEF